MIPYTRVHALQLRISNKLKPTVATKRTHCAIEGIRTRLALVIAVTYRYVVWASFYYKIIIKKEKITSMLIPMIIARVCFIFLGHLLKYSFKPYL